MAKRIVHQFIDDIDGTVLSEDDGETVHFGIDGHAYEIDLGAAHAAALRDAFARYIEAGRRSTSQAARKQRGVTKGTLSGEVRQWAASQGIDVPAKGRVPNSALEAYHAAN